MAHSAFRQIRKQPHKFPRHGCRAIRHRKNGVLRACLHGTGGHRDDSQCKATRLHPHRTDGRRLDHRHLGSLNPACRPAGPRSGEAGHLHSQLKSLGIAIHNHTESRNTFPLGVDVQPMGGSLYIPLLPYLEENSLYNSINLSDEAVDNANITASSLTPGMFLCPSDTKRSTPGAGNATNYAGNAGNPSLTGEGVFTGKALGPRDLTDGLSQTAGIAEWVVGPGTDNNPYRRGSVYQLNGSYAETPSDITAFLAACEAPNPSGISRIIGYKGQLWLEGQQFFTLYNHWLTPNQPSCVAQQGMNAATAGSQHGGGAQALMMDGGVRFIKDSIDPVLWKSIGTRSGGEAIPIDPF